MAMWGKTTCRLGYGLMPSNLLEGFSPVEVEKSLISVLQPPAGVCSTLLELPLHLTGKACLPSLGATPRLLFLNVYQAWNW